MSKRTVVDCDGCARQNITPIELRFAVGRSSDPAGGPSQEDHENLDLCVSCTQRAFAMLKKVAKLSHADSAELVKQIKKPR